MKRIWVVLGLLAALLLVLSGCGTEIKETGALTISFTVPQDGDSMYPTIPPYGRSRATRPRFIPAGTTQMDVAIYNESSNWSHVEHVAIVSGQSQYTVQIDSIPVDTGYTVEVIPIGGSDWSLVMGRSVGLEVTSGITTTASIQLELIQGGVSGLPANATIGETFTASGYLNVPESIPYVDINSVSALLVLDDTHSFWIGGSGYDDFDALVDEDFTLSGVCAGSTGLYYVEALEIEYVQPVTGLEYYLGYVLPEPQPEINILSATGSISVSIQ